MLLSAHDEGKEGHLDPGAAPRSRGELVMAVGCGQPNAIPACAAHPEYAFPSVVHSIYGYATHSRFESSLLFWQVSFACANSGSALPYHGTYLRYGYPALPGLLNAAASPRWTCRRRYLESLGFSLDRGRGPLPFCWHRNPPGPKLEMRIPSFLFKSAAQPRL